MSGKPSSPDISSIMMPVFLWYGCDFLMLELAFGRLATRSCSVAILICTDTPQITHRDTRIQWAPTFYLPAEVVEVELLIR
jgi:hypothetical protein